MPSDQAPENPRVRIGGNRPPIESFYKELNADLPAYLAEELASDIARANEMIGNAADIPDVINNEVEEANATDIVSQMKKHWKAVDSRRAGIKAGPREAEGIIDGFCKNHALEPLTKAIDRIDPAVTKFKRIKAEREKREREEKERLAREEAERQKRAAEEAQRKQREAEAAKQRALDEEKRAKEAAIKAKQDAAEAEERRKKAEANRIEQERLAEEAKTKRKREEAARAARRAQEEKEQAERDRIAAEERQANERKAAAAAKTEVALTKGELSDATKEVRTADSLAKHAESDANKATRAAGAKLSEVSGVRGDYGGQSSLRTRWVGTIIDRKKLDLEALRDFMSDEDLGKALNKFVGVHKGSRKVKGALIQEESDTAFR